MKCEGCKEKKAKCSIRTKKVCEYCFNFVRKKNIELHRRDSPIPNNFEDIKGD